MSFVTYSEAGRVLQVSRQVLYRKVAKGELKLNKDGKLDLEKARKVVNGQKEKTNGTGKSATYWDEQTRLAGHKADLAAMESRRRAHELVEADEAAKEFGKFFFALRQKLLSLGSRLAPQVEMKRAPFVKRVFDGAIDEALDEFGTYNPDTGKCKPEKPARKPGRQRAVKPKKKAAGTRTPRKVKKKAHRKRVGK